MLCSVVQCLILHPCLCCDACCRLCLMLVRVKTGTPLVASPLRCGTQRHFPVRRPLARSHHLVKKCISLFCDCTICNVPLTKNFGTFQEPLRGPCGKEPWSGHGQCSQIYVITLPSPGHTALGPKGNGRGCCHTRLFPIFAGGEPSLITLEGSPPASSLTQLLGSLCHQVVYWCGCSGHVLLFCVCVCCTGVLEVDPEMRILKADEMSGIILGYGSSSIVRRTLHR